MGRFSLGWIRLGSGYSLGLAVKAGRQKKRGGSY